MNNATVEKLGGNQYRVTAPFTVIINLDNMNIVSSELLQKMEEAGMDTDGYYTSDDVDNEEYPIHWQVAAEYAQVEDCIVEEWIENHVKETQE